MTEQHTSFGGLAVADPRTPAEPVDYSTGEAADSRRKLAMVGAVLAVVVVLIAAFFLLKGKGSDSPAPAAGGSAASVTPPGHKAPAAAKPIKLPKPYHGAVGRDPFKALYVAPAAATGTKADTTSTSATTPTTVSTTPTSGTTVPPATTTTNTFSPVWIKMTALSDTSAKFDVGFSNGKKLDVRRFTEAKPKANSPEIFAGSFALLKLQDGKVLLQYGDGTPFVLDMAHNVMIVN